jgi:hypothetical protein
MDDGGKTVQTTQNNEPWSEQKPFLTEGFNRALFGLNSNTPEYYPGQTVTDTTAATAGGQQAALDGAAASNTLRNAMVDGQYLDSGNPHFQGMVNQIGQAIRPGIDSAFAANGRLGSGAHANAFSSSLADQAGKLAFQNYGMERGFQNAAGQDFSPYQAVMGVGAQQEAKQGEYLRDGAARWDFEQNKDANKLAQYMNLVGNRSYGGQATSTQPMTGNSTMAGIGTGLAGLGALGQGLPGLLSLFK